MELGLFQKDVAAKIGTSKATLTNWEKGHAMPEMRHLPRILSFIGYDPRATPKTIGERLVAFRAGLGWNCKRLAEELKVDPSTLSRWETGKKQPWGVYLERVEALIPEVRKRDCKFKIEENGCCDHSEAARKGIKNRRDRFSSACLR